MFFVLNPGVFYINGKVFVGNTYCIGLKKYWYLKQTPHKNLRVQVLCDNNSSDIGKNEYNVYLS